MKLYSTQAKKNLPVNLKEDIGIYVCGITPYDTTHLGHAFTYVQFDVLIRLLRKLGAKVTYVQNVTDIDDDILKKSKELGVNYKKLGFEQTQQFLEDLNRLNVLMPDYYVLATDHILEIIKLTKQLLTKKYAYEKKGSVYFSVNKFKKFGEISHTLAKDFLKVANERGNDPKDPNKQHPLDFVLWQKSKKDEPSWKSPWGQGRPGWHIECTAMNTKYLGKPFTIHGGGSDLAFPHHECENAQSLGNLAKIWMHTGMLRYQGDKMSKSLGNLVLVKELLKSYSENTIRLMLLSHHYREAWEFKHQELDNAQDIENKIKKAWSKENGLGSFDIEAFKKEFYSYLENDLRTDKALRTIEKLSNKIINSNKNVVDAKNLLKEFAEVLGLKMGYTNSNLEQINFTGKKVMVIGAHPDDNDFTAGGSSAIAASKGCEVTYVIATRGNRGSSSKLTLKQLSSMRDKEQRNAAKTLGVKRVEFLDYLDGELVSDLKLKEEIVKVIRKYRPDMVFTMDPTYIYSKSKNMINHTDHRAIGEATMDAVYPLARDLLSFKKHSKLGLKPHIVSEICFHTFEPDKANAYVDITKKINNKIEALISHKSQIPNTPEFKQMIKDWANEIGRKAGVKYAEGFVRIKLRGHMKEELGKQDKKKLSD